MKWFLSHLVFICCLMSVLSAHEKLYRAPSQTNFEDREICIHLQNQRAETRAILGINSLQSDNEFNLPWRCKGCKAHNHHERTHCRKCGRVRP